MTPYSEYKGRFNRSGYSQFFIQPGAKVTLYYSACSKKIEILLCTSCQDSISDLRSTTPGPSIPSVLTLIPLSILTVWVPKDSYKRIKLTCCCDFLRKVNSLLAHKDNTRYTKIVVLPLVSLDSAESPPSDVNPKLRSWGKGPEIEK